MPETPSFSVEDVDFEATYQGAPPVRGSEVTFAVTPWDIGEAQHFVARLEGEGKLAGEILDAGSGLGENALFLAGKGHRVTGVDASATALGRARQRAQELGVRAEFVQSDATRLAELEDGRFTTVLDSALYHCLSEQQQRAYAEALHRVTAPGAQLHLFCFADRATGFVLPQFQVSQENLRANLGPWWDIQDIRPDFYTMALTKEKLAEATEGFVRLGLHVDPDEVQWDEQGRATGMIWHLHAMRR
ncbi:class I SAM-dependent methyltransferase [Streptomyces physcomitrii]|uniref:Methyltransferase domain-containing protein n=1 Tax=Streptomyces physcomitrii TaxID=2724184 RepID=A0ABX1H645_9ACTN|nr:class I SAM-dependent methyltransferase [Streptomyces physcomitrii]NKI43842.1 methyltransferase domain-containing protein [Streptomyces physcomitrii]